MSFSSMYIGASGLKTHAEGMNNLGHNIANVNTVAYKEMNMHFQTLMSAPLTTGEPALTVGSSQKGMGASVAAVITNFAQGPMNLGNAFSDMAIEGKGFFKVVDGDTAHYTRAGNFRFDADGYLVDPQGYRLQGMPITNGVTGATTDVQLNVGDEGFYSIDGAATTTLEMVLNLGMQKEASTDADNPFFSMLSEYKTSGDQPLDNDDYGYMTPMTVYDENGNPHTLNVYFDKVGVNDGSGDHYVEFLIAQDREGLSASASGQALQPYMIGTLTFDGDGALTNVAGFTLASDGANWQDLTNWTPADFGADGGLSMDAVFRGGSNAGSAQTISVNFGLTNATGLWENGDITAADVGSNGSGLPSFDGVAGSMVTTGRGGDTGLVYSEQDGTPEGFLQNLSVTEDGVIVGQYSNGQNVELYEVPLYYFTNNYGLKHEGGNHFSATADSGAAIEGSANDFDTGLGLIRGNTLEGSNVDLAQEFVTMITTQRGFQANSKVITTTDRLLEVAVQMKR